MFIVLQNVIAQIIILLVIVVFILNRFGWIRHRFFAWMYMQLLPGYTAVLVKHKKEHFAPLQKFISLDENLRKQGVIRILEIGAGPGVNFCYYPKNSKVIVIEPNPNFQKYFEENKAKFPNVNVEKVICGIGEDLGAIKDDSVDIVVTTIVLCSVRNVQQVLSEIHRVLAPGGKYFFMEHVIAPKGSWMRLRQKLGNPIWKCIFDGCQITKDVEDAINKTSFVQTDFKHVSVDINWLLKLFMSSHLYGNAQKKLLN